MDKKQDNPFSPYMDSIFPEDYKKDTNVDSASQAQATLSAYTNFLFNGSEITRSYHFGIMKQAQALLTVFSALFSIVTLFLCVMIGYVIITNNINSKTIIPIITAVAGDIFSGAMTCIMQHLLKSRDDFFRENTKVEHFSKVLGLVQTVKEEKNRLPFIESIVYGYCNKEYGENAFTPNIKS